MASINYVVQKLSAAGLTVETDGAFILAEDPNCGFERSHDGVRGISGWLKETLSEYEEALQEAAAQVVAEAFHEEDDEFPTPEEAAEIALEDGSEEPWELSPEYQAAELPQEDTVNLVEHFLSLLGVRAQEEEFAPAPPEKAHVVSSAQLDLARTYNSAKEIAQALENDLQDEGGIPDPVGYITELKQEVVHTEKVEFVVTGVGWVNGKFSRSFDEAEKAKTFARKCVAAAKNSGFAATVRVTPWYSA